VHTAAISFLFLKDAVEIFRLPKLATNRPVCPASSLNSVELAGKPHFQAILPGSALEIIKPVDNSPNSPFSGVKRYIARPVTIKKIIFILYFNYLYF
jgi:hypothetical protein